MGIRETFQPLRVRISIILILTISIALTQVPLFNYLGYEFSVAVAVSLWLISGPLTIGSFSGGSSRVSMNDVRRYQTGNLYVHLLLLCIPLIVVTFNALAVKNCSFGEGLVFYLLIPVVTTLFCLALGTLCAVLFRRPRLAYYAAGFLIAAHMLWLGYATPQIYAYNFILGYFPGLSYDEVLVITPTLLLFRAVTLVAATFCFLLSLLIIHESTPAGGASAKLLGVVRSFLRTWKYRNAFLLVSAGTLLASWLYRVDLGFESSHAAMKETLDRVVQTDHFVIHVGRDSFTEEEMRRIADEHEFRLFQVTQKLQVSFDGIIASYIYPTEEIKRRFVGTGTDIAKPWRREMHLNEKTWQRVLKHELVHIVAGGFGMPLIRAHYRIGLVEGLAMAVEWDFGNRTLHEYAASMERFGLMQDVGRLLSMAGFALQPSTVSYVLSGSFCRFLIDRYGIVRFKELYRGNSFTSTYQKNVASLVREWRHFLRRVPVHEEWEPHVQYLFNRRSIFAKDCARYIARLNSQGYFELYGGNPERAMDVFGISLRENWNTEAFAGFVHSAFRTVRYDTLVNLMDVQLQKNFFSVANLLLMYGDAHWAKGNLVSARTSYENVLGLDLSESSNEAAALRLMVLEDPSLQKELQSLFVRHEPDSAKLRAIERALETSDHPVLHLLRARHLYQRRNYEEALKILDGWRSHNRNIEYTREKLRGLCNFYLREYQRARSHIWQAMNFTSNEASSLRLHEWIDRCEWMESREQAE